MTNFEPCPFCGGTNIDVHISSTSSSCYVQCTDCGATINREVSQTGCSSKADYDERCLRILKNAWNKRAPITEIKKCCASCQHLSKLHDIYLCEHQIGAIENPNTNYCALYRS